MSKITTGRFFVPGPTEVRAEILQAMTGPMIPHRSAAFESLYASCQTGLRAVFGTSGAVLVSASSGTGMMEAGIRGARPGAVLALVNGAFSARYADIAQACGREVQILEAAVGTVVPLDQIESALKQRKYAAVLVPHCETATGVRSDIRSVSDLAHKHDAICLVDSISALAGIPAKFDEWGLDYLLTGSQKALALPPGLSFAAASPKYLDEVKSAPARGRYLDIGELHDWALKNQTPATPAVSLMYALDAQLKDIMAEGLPARWARHAAMAKTVADWVAGSKARNGHEIGILAGPDCRAETVTALTMPSYIKGPDLVAAVAKRGYTLATGYGALNERTVRIGHMGDHSVAGLTTFLGVMDEALRDMKG